MGKSILFVDDERQILKSFKRLFMESDYTIFLADGGEQALEILKNEQIDLLITDIMMPQMNGYELLQIVEKQYPRIIRIILSGYSKEKDILQALQQNLAKTYLFKPWDNESLVNFIHHIFRVEEMLQDHHIFDMIKEIDSLPTIVTLYNRLKKLISENASMDDIAHVIEEDQSISSNILRLANSAFYGLGTASVKKAVTYLGLNNVSNIALGSSILFHMEKRKSVCHEKTLWKHASITNHLTSVFYEKLVGKKLPDVYVTAGLLHDIGKVILLERYFREKQPSSQDKPKQITETFFEELENKYQISHDSLGGCLLNWWGLPYPLVETALFHHTPLDDKIINKELVAVVHLSNFYSWVYLDVKKDSPVYEGVFTLLKTSKEVCDTIYQDVKDTIEILS
ncbi:MAG: HDOD domain-containing protein [Bacillota bacterium]